MILVTFGVLLTIWLWLLGLLLCLKSGTALATGKLVGIIWNLEFIISHGWLGTN